MSSEPNTKKYGIVKIALNLASACLVSGVVIAATFFITAPIAEQKSIQLKNDAMKSLVEGAENFQPVEGKENWFIAEKGGSAVAYIVPSENKGYAGTIKLLVAVNTEGRVIDYDILAHSETPGLGDNASKAPFRDQFNGKSAGSLKVVKDPTNKENIQAMTGATISSKAVTDGVKKAVDEVKQYLGG